MGATKSIESPLGLKFTLADLRKSIPEEAFKKDFSKSLFYMGFDYAMWGAALFAMSTLVNSSIWPTLPFIAKAASSLLYWNVAGFFMWCIFIVGHDCGHTTFSNNKVLNDFLGHVTHGSILVPFFPWQLSHRRHHMFHNHVEKDYSYGWFTPDKESSPSFKFHKNPVIRALFPFFAWFVYLSGVDDGNHFIPLKDQKLWKNTPKVEYTKALISTASVAFFAAANYLFYGSLSKMAFFYGAPLIVFGWWLVCVTYLQHHHEESVVYDEEDWKFLDATFETIDRKYGFGIDHLAHHITDGHVVHHLFYTLIPHYNLPIATKAVQKFLKDNGAEKHYRLVETYDFPARMHGYLMKFGLKSKRFNTNWQPKQAEALPAGSA